MLENNTFRMIMGVLAVISVGIMITLLIKNFGSIEGIITNLIDKRVQKY